MTRQRIFISPARFGGAYVIFDVRSAISHNKSDFCYFHSCPFKLSESMSCNPRNPNYYIIFVIDWSKVEIIYFWIFLRRDVHQTDQLHCFNVVDYKCAMLATASNSLFANKCVSKSISWRFVLHHHSAAVAFALKRERSLRRHPTPAHLYVLSIIECFFCEYCLTFDFIVPSIVKIGLHHQMIFYM